MPQYPVTLNLPQTLTLGAKVSSVGKAKGGIKFQPGTHLMSEEVLSEAYKIMADTKNGPISYFKALIDDGVLDVGDAEPTPEEAEAAAKTEPEPAPLDPEYVAATEAAEAGPPPEDVEQAEPEGEPENLFAEPSAEPSAEVYTDETDFNSMKVAQLREAYSEVLGEDPAGMKKDELLAAINEALGR